MSCQLQIDLNLSQFFQDKALQSQKFFQRFCSEINYCATTCYRCIKTVATVFFFDTRLILNYCIYHGLSVFIKSMSRLSRTTQHDVRKKNCILKYFKPQNKT